MKMAHRWLLHELGGLAFEPYADKLPMIEVLFVSLVELENSFSAACGSKLTKRQAVAFGLLSRTYQLGVSCLTNQLLQNHAGWHCSFRSLLETFFVIDWLAADYQRFEAYFEGTAPGIGKIKNESCSRHPHWMQPYNSSSEVTHVGFRSLHLSTKKVVANEDELPFTVSSMGIGPEELTHMICGFLRLMTDCEAALRTMIVTDESRLGTGEILWDKGLTKAKYGCLSYAPRKATTSTETDTCTGSRAEG
jgi:hypothetical protein